MTRVISRVMMRVLFLSGGASNVGLREFSTRAVTHIPEHVNWNFPAPSLGELPVEVESLRKGDHRSIL